MEAGHLGSTLVARNLKKSYGGFEAVRGVDFEVHRGECFGFLGPNGAGKTTTMKMIYGAVIPTGGELEVAGLDVRRCEREIKRRIGVVPQENNLDDELKVRENLLVYGRYYDLRRKLARDAFFAVRSRTGEDFVDYFASTLCSVSQNLREEHFALLAHELHHNREEVRTLTMLALSARG